jgi:hypothetical protein
MSTLHNWSGQDEADFASNIKRYTTKRNAELFVQSSLGYYKDQRYPEEQLIQIEKCMRDILDRTYFEEETQVEVSGIQSGRVKKDLKSYTLQDWDDLNSICKPFKFLNIRVRGSDVVRTLRLIEHRNKLLKQPEDVIHVTGKGKIKWDIIFQEPCKD